MPPQPAGQTPAQPPVTEAPPTQQPEQPTQPAQPQMSPQPAAPTTTQPPVTETPPAQQPEQPAADFPDLSIDLPPVDSAPIPDTTTGSDSAPDLENLDISDFSLDNNHPKQDQQIPENKAPAPATLTQSEDPFAQFSSEDMDLDFDESLLPPKKPQEPPQAAQNSDIPQTPMPQQQPASPQSEPLDGLSLDDDVPLPPLKPKEPETPASPGQADPFALDLDDDTPLPPLKPKEPEGQDSKDPFAALFSDSALESADEEKSGEQKGKDPFASLDLDLDVLEVFPSDASDNGQPQTPSSGAQPSSQQPPQPPEQQSKEENPFNFDNVLDLDSPVEDNKKGEKDKDPFDLDDFDISKFKV
jgi:hypothetical protein